MSEVTFKATASPDNNVCIFIDWYLPGFKAGGPIQSVANMVAHLSKFKKFYIVTRDTDYCETVPYNGIKPNQWTKIQNNVWVFYFSADAINYKNIQSILKYNKFEKVYLNGVFSVWFTIIPIYICNKLKFENVIIGARGMLAPSALSIKKSKKKLFLITSKILGLFKKATFHATNIEEKSQIEKVLGVTKNVFVAANFSKPIQEKNLIQINKNVGELKIINVARIAPEKNLLFALRTLMHVKSEIDFNIYGPIYNQEYWNECLQVIKNLPSNVSVTYKGAIENNKVNAEIAMHHAMYMPTKGENFGHIILESFMAARPVIISDLTPWKNLKAKNVGVEISLNNETDFSNAIDELAYMNADQFQSMCKEIFVFAKSIAENEKDLEDNKKLFAIKS